MNDGPTRVANCPHANCRGSAAGPWEAGQCRMCWNLLNNPNFRAVWERHLGPPQPPGSVRVVTTVTLSPTSTPLPVIHPDRCDFFLGRKEYNPGCAGWKCEGECSLGLVAVPCGTCQECGQYKPDPDYAGQGPAGWIK